MNALFRYKPKMLQPGELKAAFKQAVAEVVEFPVEITVDHPSKTAAGVSDFITLDEESLPSVVDLSRIDLFLHAKRSVAFAIERIDLSLKAEHETLTITAIGKESVSCLERFVLRLGLEQTESPESPIVKAFRAIVSRVSALERAAAVVERKLKCFISFKFDDAQAKHHVDRLKQFLSALHIELVTGEQFEPRRIEDKVKARLRADIDFVIAVITKTGESKWIRDEFADANARGLWVVVLLEEGATFDKGIFGTLEYLRYDLAIDQTFVGLVEGINFIKAEISTIVEHQD